MSLGKLSKVHWIPSESLSLNEDRLIFLLLARKFQKSNNRPYIFPKYSDVISFTFKGHYGLDKWPQSSIC
jgi:hypothetical protein